MLRNLPLTVVKSKGKISQNFLAFSEYMNFTTNLESQNTGWTVNDAIYRCMTMKLCALYVKMYYVELVFYCTYAN